MQPLQICIGPTIRIGRESWCLPYAGFFVYDLKKSFLSKLLDSIKGASNETFVTKGEFESNFLN